MVSIMGAKLGPSLPFHGDNFLPPFSLGFQPFCGPLSSAVSLNGGDF
jgi:hypothetical protein